MVASWIAADSESIIFFLGLSHTPV